MIPFVKGFPGFLLMGVAMAADTPAWIPMPREMAMAEGRFTLPRDYGLQLDRPADGLRLIGMLRDKGLAPETTAATASIEVKRAAVKNPTGFPGAYRLEISTDRIIITTNDDFGALHATETLRQAFDKTGSLPCGKIEDWPAFPVRGFMLDTGRNFQSVALLKEQIEAMARYKLNVFHFHFTDNPGWRLESKVHPKVNDPASMSRLPGKIYTQQDFRELVKFCRERGITLVPEMDMPGHSEAFRKALGITSMNAPESRRILKDLLTEMASLATPEELPFIHLGTDEVRGAAEKVDATFLPEMAAHVRSLGREVIGWRGGIEDPADKKRITQLWSRANPLKENPFIDSRSTYLNHMDAFDAVSCLFFQQSCRQPHGDALARGGILCSWPDIRIENERDQLRQNPIYPGMVTFAESLWRGVPVDDKEAYWGNLPAPDTKEFERFREFEGRLLDHKQRFFADKEFPYVKQSEQRWKIIGPFPNDGDVLKEFSVEKKLEASYLLEGQTFEWMNRDVAGATVHLKHFFGFGSLVKESEGTCYALTHVWSPKEQDMPSWIGFSATSRSDRRGGPTAAQGEWNQTKPWIRVNGNFIAPPVWKNPGLPLASNEIPFTDEDYFFRAPSTIHLKQGWNEILLKIPHRKSDWKWMFTFAPVGDTTGLRHSSSLTPTP